MLKRFLAAFAVALAAGTAAMAQTGTLKGKVVDGATGEGLSFANVQLEQDGNPVGKTVADIDGNYTIKPIPPGKYDLKAAAVGYKTLVIRGVIIGGDKTTYQDLKVESTVETKETFTFVEYTEPLIDPDTKSGGTVTREEFQAMPSKNINSVASTTAGVFQQDEGDALNVRGSRDEGTDYYVDGEKVRGSAGLPQSSIEQVSVITGGVPAQYGDATGGFINITTRGGIRNEYIGGVELISSQLTDAYGYNFAGFNVGGPLMAKKDSAGNKDAKVGFFISGEVSTDKDPDPSAVGVYKVKDEKLAELEAAPLSASESGGTLLNAELLRMDDLEKVKARQNVKRNSLRVAGKLDFKLSKNMTFTLGGSMDYARYHSFTYEYALLNPSNNPEYIDNTKRIYGKISHKLGKDKGKDDKPSLFSNSFYTLQVGYTKYTQTEQDDTHGDNYFNYGHIGKFETLKSRAYSLVSNDLDTILDSTYYEQVAWADTQVVFNAAETNPLAANYTSQFYDLVAGDPNNLAAIQTGYGLLNGDRPRAVYSIWHNTGRQYTRSYKLDQTQLRVTGQFSTDMKNHAIQLGFEYEKRDDRYWQVSPVGLWGLMRQLANRHITQLDDNVMNSVTGPIMLTSGSVVANPAYNAYAHPYLVNASEESFFSKSLRGSLGKSNSEWIDIDSYDPATFNLNMFSPDELLNAGNSYVSYYGYNFDGSDKNGKIDNDLTTLENYYKAKDANGNMARVAPSFQPTYVAGYIQDKFDVKDMKFNIGVRVDHFNANQPMLKDKFLLYEANTVAEASGFTHPTNVPSTAVVYVDDAKNPTSVLGYRDGDTWYNANGVEIADPKSITPSTGIIQPYLKYPNEKFLDSSKVSNIFDMYKAQNTFMPRISFAFPISDKANFFAHYDVLTQRPPAGLRFSPTGLLYIQSVGGVVANSGLKPERTTDYELGFSQVLNEKKNAALTLSAFYREMRDMIQQVVLSGAYPISYTTYENIDFGNVKGFSVSYDLRRTGNVQMTASYTLQFAEGTGSASNSAGGIISVGQPNLRTTMPLDFDQRHAIVMNLDYRFGEGADYKGPQAGWAKKIFQNMGGNMVFRTGSGLPYTRQQNVTSGNGDNSSAVVFGINQRASMKGKLNGSNLPWQYRIDLRIDKNINLIWKKAEGENKGKKSNLNIYLQVLNVLNTKNVINLYRYTGDPDDDGYLSAPENQNGINNYLDPQSFRDLYTSKIAHPSHYSIPRRTRIGIVLDF